jgi:hypothetical protein
MQAPRANPDHVRTLSVNWCRSRCTTAASPFRIASNGVQAAVRRRRIVRA